MALNTVEHRQEEIEKLHAEWFPKEKDEPKLTRHGMTHLDDQKLIEKACAAANGYTAETLPAMNHSQRAIWDFVTS
jgi:hypothetical protein